MAAKNKRLICIVLTAILLLLVPLVAMLFTNEVSWEVSDFAVAGALLIGAGLIIEIVIRKVKQPGPRLILIFSIVVLLFLIWVELAVGLFGTAFTGS